MQEVNTDQPHGAYFCAVCSQAAAHKHYDKAQTQNDHTQTDLGRYGNCIFRVVPLVPHHREERGEGANNEGVDRLEPRSGDGEDFA